MNAFYRFGAEPLIKRSAVHATGNWYPNIKKWNLFFLIFFSALAGCQNEPADSDTSSASAETVYADSIYYNGKIHTLDEQRAWAEAVAIKDGKFLATGASEEILKLAGSETKQHDLGGHMAMPGLHDAHFHLMVALTALDCNPGNFKWEKLRETLSHCKTQQVEGHPWVVINGLELWHDIQGLTNDIVNEVLPDTPVLIRDATGHNRLVNDKALELAGIDKDTPDPQGGEIVRDPETGEPTGLLVELSAGFMVEHQIPSYPANIVNQTLEETLRSLLNQGITSIQDAYIMDRVLLESLANLDRQGIPMPYVMTHLGWFYPEGEFKQGLEAAIRNRAQYATRHVSTEAVKVFIDGVPVPPKPTHVPILEDGTIDETNLLIPRDVLAQKFIEWDKAGLKIKMHTAGNGAARIGLDAIEATRKANGDSGVWHEITHAGDVDPADFPRFAPLRAVADMSPYFWPLGGMLGSTGFRFRSLYNEGALITLGSDNIILPSFNPFPPLQGIVERVDVGGVDESLPIETALEFMTRNGAESMGRSDEMGSIEPGKIANMIVLDRNLLEIPANEIGGTKVLKTILDGNIVYEGIR